jgi:acetolactate synthase-1/2/3 large subunit
VVDDLVTGAEALLHAAAAGGVDVCFANPGTTEMPLVAALDRVPGVRAVLGLHENVCTGAADGYARISGRAAMTLLHLGPGLANGIANLHNARRAHTPIVNIVGDHTSWHLPFDAPLTSDIAGLAGTVGTVHAVAASDSAAEMMRTALDDAHNRLGIATVVFPADFQQGCATSKEAPLRSVIHRKPVSSSHIEQVAHRITSAGPGRVVLLLGGNALSRRGQLAAGRLAAVAGVKLFCETFPACAERGGGLPDIDRLPYFPERAVAALHGSAAVIVAGADDPVAYFGYENLPSELAPQGSLLRLAGVDEDAEAALSELAEIVGGTQDVTRFDQPGPPPPDAEPLTGASVGATVAAALPDGAIVSVEGGTCGYPFYTAGAGAAAHTVLTNTGGAIGQGLPCALGASIAAPDRPVIALQSDGSGLYTVQSLWSMSRERANVTVLIAANHTYNVLRTELDRHGNSEFGTQAAALTSLADPRMDWVALANGFGVSATRVTSNGDLRHTLTTALRDGGPHLIEMAL